MRQGRHLAKFQAIMDYHEEHPETTLSYLCQLAGVSRSGYYKWLSHEATVSEQENQLIMAKIMELHAAHNGILGYRRMTLYVNRELGTNYNPKRILRLMRLLGISSIIRRKRGYCTKAGFKNIEGNILNRDFKASAPNEKWCTDVTYVTYGLGCKA